MAVRPLPSKPSQVSACHPPNNPGIAISDPDNNKQILTLGNVIYGIHHLLRLLLPMPRPES
jgi:hypothetical protein